MSDEVKDKITNMQKVEKITIIEGFKDKHRVREFQCKDSGNLHYGAFDGARLDEIHILSRLKSKSDIEGLMRFLQTALHCFEE